MKWNWASTCVCVCVCVCICVCIKDEKKSPGTPVGDGVGRLLYGEKLLPGVCGVNGPWGEGVSGL